MTEKQKNIIWIAALVSGIFFGSLNINTLNAVFNFIAAVYTRLFQFAAVPAVSLAVIGALSKLGAERNTGRIFACTVRYTILTTFAAALAALILYVIVMPENLAASVQSASDAPQQSVSYYEHILSVIPNNIFQPFISGNVLSVIIVSASIGIGLSFMPETENKKALVNVIFGLQELVFTLIKGLIFILPIGIAAFAAQFVSQISGCSSLGGLGRYTAVVLGGNLLQMFVIIPLFLLSKKLNPVLTFKNMSSAVITAFFTKSSAGTLPVTLSAAENNLKIKPEVSRFVLPLCTTVNMNGCAAFILVTSLFTMQNAGMELSIGTMIIWLFISVFAAIGNAGVPMGCYFLTVSLMSSIGAPIGILGVILPIYAVIDMVETAENVWSDSAVCTMANEDLL